MMLQLTSDVFSTFSTEKKTKGFISLAVSDSFSSCYRLTKLKTKIITGNLTVKCYQ